MPWRRSTWLWPRPWPWPYLAHFSWLAAFKPPLASTLRGAAEISRQSEHALWPLLGRRGAGALGAQLCVAPTFADSGAAAGPCAWPHVDCRSYAWSHHLASSHIAVPTARPPRPAPQSWSQQRAVAETPVRHVLRGLEIGAEHCRALPEASQPLRRGIALPFCSARSLPAAAVSPLATPPDVDPQPWV